MDTPRVYIDGQEGTTGLRIRELLSDRADLALSLIGVEDRKNDDVRRQYLNEADIAILCLPDDAAAEALDLLDPSAGTKIIDTSTARRTHPDWVYGLPELSPTQRQAIINSDRVANCGCYPVGYLLAVRPLVEAGLLRADAALTVNAVSGYSGGGRRMIESYQAIEPGEHGDAGRPLCLYGLDGNHKHLTEMTALSGGLPTPLFVPSVDHAFCGMLTSTPIPASSWASKVDPEAVWRVWQERYDSEPFIRPIPPDQATEHLRDGRTLELGDCNFTNRLDLFVFGDPDVGLVLIGRLDNLGKGASGNAVQCLNLMIGVDESTGLVSGL